MLAMVGTGTDWGEFVSRLGREPRSHIRQLPPLTGGGRGGQPGSRAR